MAETVADLMVKDVLTVEPSDTIGEAAEKMNDAFDRVWQISLERGITLRTAALVAGIREVAGALDARGLYP